MAPIALEQLDRRTQFRWQSHQFDLGPVSIIVQQYGAAYRASSTERGPDIFSISLPLTAVSGEATFAGVRQPIVRGDVTYVHSPCGPTAFRFGTHYRGLQFVVRGAEMSSVLGALMGSAPKEGVRFQHRLSLARGIGASLARAVTFAADEATHDGGLLAVPAAASRFGEGLLASLLARHGHNYSDRLREIDRASDPRSVRVAAAWLEANATKVIRMTELAAVAGVSLRALQIGFLRHRGCTPMEFLRARRLDLAHARLLVSAPGASIGPIARECGFSHLGRFSGYHRARFGERPTETLSRR